MTSIVQSAKLLLAPMAAAYYAVQKIREKGYEWNFLKKDEPPVPVISIGNLLLGGSGKTPFVMFLAEMLQKLGLKPAVVSRGYRGKNRERFLVVSNGSGSGPLVKPTLSGDEPYLIANRLSSIPVVIGRKRIYPVRAAYELFGSQVILLDDGFQHLSIKRDIDIVLLNCSEDYMFPMGRLREPLSALNRADIIVLVDADFDSLKRKCRRSIPVFKIHTVPMALVSGL